MSRKLVVVFLFCLTFGIVKAQTEKTTVLVVGNNNAAVAAAIQAAVSGVKTTILLQAGGFDISPIGDNLHSGIEASFLAKLKAENSAFDKQVANKIFTKWTDSLKNLTVVKNVLWLKADAYTNSWALKLTDGKTIKAKILINAGDSKLYDALKIKPTKENFKPLDYQQSTYRTSVAAGKKAAGTTGNFFSLYQLFTASQDNLVQISDIESMLQGQAAGATAAYAGFFGKKTSESNLKAIQGELINYKLNIVPFADVKLTDTNWKAIQFVGVTGVLQASTKGNEALFMPNQLVTTDEIKQPLKEFFYKAQIWFDDYKKPQMTIGSAIDMVCYIGNKSLVDTKKLLEKNWKTAYGFTSTFDIERPINRREFAVILQGFMPPFNVNVNQTGKVVR